MRILHQTILLLAIFFTLSCAKEVRMSYTEESSEAVAALTKADVPAFVEGEFDFSVHEKDVREYIERQKDIPRIISIEPQVREGDTLLYIANMEQGWKIFSADKHLPPILAEIPKGSFNQKFLDISGLRLWTKSMMDLTCEIRQERDISSATTYTNLWAGHLVLNNKEGVKKGVRGLSTNPTWTRVTINQYTTLDPVLVKEPLLETNWGQGSPWNESLPLHHLWAYYPTGCVAVAVSQLLYYYHHVINCPSGLYHGISIASWNYHPSTYDYSHAYYTTVLSRSNYQNNSIRWGQMVKDEEEYLTYYPSSILGASYVSDLMVDVGNRANTKYWEDATGSASTIGDAQMALASFDLLSNHDSFSSPAAFANILNEKPLLMAGVDSTNYEIPEGHAWVVDGAVKLQQVNHSIYQWWLGYSVGAAPYGEEMTISEAREAAFQMGYDKPEDGMITHETTYSSNYYYTFHMNWGHYGEGNGYFFPTDQVVINEHTYQYAASQEMLHNIRAISK